MAAVTRTYRDRCPGVLRPWIADDGALVRLRLVGGRTTKGALRHLLEISSDYADGNVAMTKRANLQLRGIAHEDGCIDPDFVEAVTEAGFLPVPTHELVRNIMVSPLTGRRGGQADLGPAVERLDELLCADPAFAGLSARFLFVLDDGRGDLSDRTLDVGAMAVDAEHAQVRVGSEHWGDVVTLEDLPQALLDVALRFVDVRGTDDDAPWHVDELGGADGPGVEALSGPPHARDLRTHVTSLPLPQGMITQDDGRSVEHVPVPDGLLTPDLARPLLDRAAGPVVVTPWRSLLLPDLETA